MPLRCQGVFDYSTFDQRKRVPYAVGVTSSQHESTYVYVTRIFLWYFWAWVEPFPSNRYSLRHCKLCIVSCDDGRIGATIRTCYSEHHLTKSIYLVQRTIITWSPLHPAWHNWLARETFTIIVISRLRVRASPWELYLLPFCQTSIHSLSSAFTTSTCSPACVLGVNVVAAHQATCAT